MNGASPEIAKKTTLFYNNGGGGGCLTRRRKGCFFAKPRASLLRFAFHFHHATRPRTEKIALSTKEALRVLCRA